jgi:hypothetical protein
VLDPASLTAYELSARVERMMTTFCERLTNLDREVLREAVRRAGERDGVVDALLDRTLQWEPQLECNRLLEAVADAALALRQGERDAGRRLDAALVRLLDAPNPGRGWLAPEAVRLVREALQGVLDGLARRPPVVGTLAAGRVKDALAVLLGAADIGWHKRGASDGLFARADVQAAAECATHR